MKYLAIIPARSGSKQIKNKNLIKLNNKELIYWTIYAARKSKYINKIIVSTDSNKIAKTAIKYGAEVPFLRSIKISQDKSNTIDAVLSVISKYKEKFDNIILLQPTSPFRNFKNIDESIKLFENSKTNSLVSITKSIKNNELLFEIKKGLIKINNFKKFNNKRRQEFKENYYVNGAIYINNIKNLVKNKKFVNRSTMTYKMEYIDSIDIDTHEDLKISEYFKQYLMRK
tara:strand:- start:1076 stop:1759 length:684 start_codon:yes stop_codon:yes gene_type:complete